MNRFEGIGRTLSIGGLLVAGLLMFATPRDAAAQCSISGPTSVEIDQSFRLCGPGNDDYTYQWYGPGIPSGTYSRCVTVNGRQSGGLQYTLITRLNGAEVDRCTHLVNVGGVGVGGGGTGSLTCVVSGPTTVEEGGRAELCAPSSSLHTYSWTGPGGFTASSRCVSVWREGTYTLTIRNRLTGSVRQCSHSLDIQGTGPDYGTGNFTVSGPTSIRSGTSARLCAPSFGDGSYTWQGPNGFGATSRCVTVTSPGRYYVTVRDYSTGRTQTGSLLLRVDGNTGDDDYDTPDDGTSGIYENCPRDLAFWRDQCRSGRTNDLRQIARRIDERSRYFNWSDDMAGFCSTMEPARPLTWRKQAARQLAALLANVAAGEYDIMPARSGERIQLDLNTQVRYRGTMTTIRSLISRTDDMLVSNRNNAGLAQITRTLTSINNGLGIGPVCQ